MIPRRTEMKLVSPVLAVCLFSLLIPPPACTGQENEQGTTTGYPKAVLVKRYTPMLGDLIALSASELISAFKGFSDAPAIAIFNRDAKKIVIIVYGSRST